MCALDVRPALRTERLILRAPVTGDAAVVAELANDIGVTGNLQTWPHPFTEADAEAWLAEVVSADPRVRTDFLIEHRHFGPIGVIGVGEDARQDHRPGSNWGARPQLGYWLGRPFWNRGYMTEAVDAVLRWVQADWRRNVVWAGHFADNKASAQVLVKAGFLYTGDVELKPSMARGGEAVPHRMMVWLA